MTKGKRILILITIIALALWWFCLPDPLFRSSYSTVLLDKDDQLLGARIAHDGQWRFPADGFEVPETFAKSIIQFEDRRFYHHNGIDIIAIGRAIRDNIAERAIVSGGSTLTMQTMRLARGNTKRNLWSKIVEACWSVRAELTYSKKELLHLYAAHAPFGGNVVGLGAASWRYYHKTPDQLSWGEAAALAVLPNAPGMVHPGRNRDAFLQKRNRLIEQLRENGIIDETEASLALQEPLPAEPHPLPNAAPHLLSQFAQTGKTIHSTIDIAMQERTHELLQRYSDILSMNGVNNAALMIMETETGNVRAYIGNVSHASKAHQNDVDIIRSERSSGSILKPFLHCAALEEGMIAPSAMVDDIPTYIRGYQPLNFSEEYMGMVRADEALAMSLNVPAVRLLQQYGILSFKEKLIKAGITTLHYSPDHYGLPLILGGAEVTLFDICGAYASMGRVLNNVYRNNHQYSASDIHGPLTEQRRNGAMDKQIDMSERKSPRLVSGVEPSEDLGAEPTVWNAAAIYQTFEAMRTLRRPDQEGQWETYAGSVQIAWKTGTSFGFRDAWAVGVTPTYTIGVWVGNADGEGRPGVIGLHAAAPILFDVLRLLNPPAEWWDPPYDAMMPMMTCNESGWLAGSTCAHTDTTYIVKGKQVPRTCDFHTKVYVDRSEQFSFDPVCMPVDALLTTYFTVPTLAENYYKRFHPEYRIIPPVHPSCSGDQHQRKDIALIYPRHGSKIYVPYEWDKVKSKAVFSAVHRSDTSPIYWHLDKQFIGKTTEFHQMEVDPVPGMHVLTLQDESGSVVTTQFEVLTK